MTKERFTWSDIGMKVRLVIALIIFSFLILGAFSFSSRTAFTSSEVKFTDASAHGLAIVPASCPSPPFTELYAGECGTGSPICADGTPAPFGDPAECPGGGGGGGGGCAIGYTSQGGTCSFTGCPAWYTKQGTQCVLLGCPGGYVLQGNQCIINTCPSNYTLQGGQCVIASCPQGQTVQNGACVAYGSCIAGNECIGQNLYARTVSCSATLVQTCGFGCGGGACIIPPPALSDWRILPTLVQKNSTVQVIWNGQNVASCTVSGTNGDSWTGASGHQTSGPITGQTIYSIVCQGLPGSSPPTVSSSITVNIVPQFQEQ